VTRLVQDDVDPITPIAIQHQVDAVWSDSGELEAHYNFVDYAFEQGDAFMRARFYLDEAHEVLIYGPFKPGTVDRRKAPAFEAAVLAYLGRRFRNLKRL
jgi:hypothetical protein